VQKQQEIVMAGSQKVLAGSAMLSIQISCAPRPSLFQKTETKQQQQQQPTAAVEDE
jgi:hypothetical protein